MHSNFIQRLKKRNKGTVDHLLPPTRAPGTMAGGGAAVEQRRLAAQRGPGADLGAWRRSPEAGEGGAGVRRLRRAAEAAEMAGGAVN